MLPDTEIKFLKGVGEKRAEQFSKLGVDNINALLHFYPRAYEDWSNPVLIAGSESDEKCCVKATVMAPVTRWRAKSGITMFKTQVFDSTGALDIIIFNNRYSAAKLIQGCEYLFYGTVTLKGGRRQMLSPSIEDVGKNQIIRPVYRRTGTLSSRFIEKCMKIALSGVTGEMQDFMPPDVTEKYDLMPLLEALEQIHFPVDLSHMRRARERFIFEELFCLQVGFSIMSENKKAPTQVRLLNDYTDEFFSKLPFSPTGAQRRAVREAVADLQSGHVMRRLLQGDVGSGKTMVAAALMYDMARNGYQSAMMAPTEILAKQHFDTLSGFFKDTGVEVVLLTGGMGAAQKRDALRAISGGSADVVVGTHALISDGVQFKNSGFVITDEQHRFGVNQRNVLSEKGEGTHVLVMSATPIPRTLALAVYGDLDISVIDELPAGRKPVETYMIDSSIRMRAFGYIKKFLDEGRQAFVVCPLVEEGENEALLSASEYYEKIRKNEFKDYRVGLLHGKMSAAKKQEVMERFVAGDIDLLVSTVVIEVGVDVPNAVIILIENAERFGLSQLHQLRGRVGRSDYKSTCILLSDNKTELTGKRLSVMCATNDGFEIAKRDLELRGPGDFLGERQHGLPELKIADMLDNMDVLKLAGEAAKDLIKEDPSLEKPENLLLKSEVNRMFERVSLS
ncbi:MAG: ATP-dependent DNA helicase RecG [Clostridia bacterium]|nr:ATP-dependent DNA helicase RecG [Clostridia bacterium]